MKEFVIGITIVAVIFSIIVAPIEIGERNKCAETASIIGLEFRKGFGCSCEVKLPNGYWKDMEDYIRETGINYLHELNLGE